MTDRESNRCVECGQIVEIAEEFSDKPIVCESCEFLDSNDSGIGDETENEETDVVDEGPDEAEMERVRLESVLSKLPRKFLADDPDFVDHRVSRNQHEKVLLPDGGGGVQSVDGNIVRIKHKGQMIELVALSPEQRQKRQRLVNLVSIVLGAVFLLLFFLWFSR